MISSTKLPWPPSTLFDQNVILWVKNDSILRIRIFNLLKALGARVLEHINPGIATQPLYIIESEPDPMPPVLPQQEFVAPVMPSGMSKRSQQVFKNMATSKSTPTPSNKGSATVQSAMKFQYEHEVYVKHGFPWTFVPAEDVIPVLEDMIERNTCLSNFYMPSCILNDWKNRHVPLEKKYPMDRKGRPTQPRLHWNSSGYSSPFLFPSKSNRMLKPPVPEPPVDRPIELANDQAGYCELCNENYKSLKDHMVSRCHTFCKWDSSNFECIDEVIALSKELKINPRPLGPEYNGARRYIRLMMDHKWSLEDEHERICAEEDFRSPEKTSNVPFSTPSFTMSKIETASVNKSIPKRTIAEILGLNTSVLSSVSAASSGYEPNAPVKNRVLDTSIVNPLVSPGNILRTPENRKILRSTTKSTSASTCVNLSATNMSILSASTTTCGNSSVNSKALGKRSKDESVVDDSFNNADKMDKPLSNSKKSKTSLAASLEASNEKSADITFISESADDAITTKSRHSTRAKVIKSVSELDTKVTKSLEKKPKLNSKSKNGDEVQSSNSRSESKENKDISNTFRNESKEITGASFAPVSPILVNTTHDVTFVDEQLADSLKENVDSGNKISWKNNNRDVPSYGKKKLAAKACVTELLADSGPRKFKMFSTSKNEISDIKLVDEKKDRGKDTKSERSTKSMKKSCEDDEKEAGLQRSNKRISGARLSEVESLIVKNVHDSAKKVSNKQCSSQLDSVYPVSSNLTKRKSNIELRKSPPSVAKSRKCSSSPRLNSSIFVDDNLENDTLKMADVVKSSLSSRKTKKTIVSCKLISSKCNDEFVF